MPVSLRAVIRPIAIRAMLAREWWQSGVTYNPLSPRVCHNPYPTYVALRAKDPVHWSPLMHSWVFARYNDVDAPVAGNETTTNLIGNGMLALLRHPDQMQALRQDPGLMAAAVEELLRYDSPVQVDGRTALEDMEIGGRHITKGQSMTLLLGSANRDPDIFSHPERLDITRDETSHISFGRGLHHCLGAPLARLEGRLAFEMLFERFTELHLLSDRPSFKDNVVLRGLEVLPVGAKS